LNKPKKTVIKALSVQVPPILADVFEEVAGAVYKIRETMEDVKKVFDPYLHRAVCNYLPADSVLSSSYHSSNIR
jgi:dsRNA-specific ribonuclease